MGRVSHNVPRLDLRRARLTLSGANCVMGPRETAAHLDEVLAFLRAGRVRAHREGDAVVIEPVPGSPHRLNRSAAALEQTGTQLSYNGTLFGEYVAEGETPARVLLSLAEIQGGAVTRSSVSIGRVLQRNHAAHSPLRELWSTSVSPLEGQTGDDAPTRFTAVAVAGQAHIVNQAAVLVRRAARTRRPLDGDGWAAVAELRRALTQLSVELSTLTGLADAGLRDLPRSKPRRGEDGTVSFDGPGRRYTLYPGALSTRGMRADRAAAREALEALRSLAPTLAARARELALEPDAGAAAVKAVDLVRDLNQAGHASADEALVAAAPRKLPARLRAREGVPALQASFDAALALFEAGGSSEDFLAHAEKLLAGQGVAFERVGETLRIVAGEQTPLNLWALRLAEAGIGVQYAPGSMLGSSTDATFSIARDGGPFTRLMQVSHRTIREAVWDGSCRHELEHALEYLRLKVGRRGLWSGYMETKDGSDLVPGLPAQGAYSTSQAFHEITGFVVTAVEALAEAEALLATEGPTSMRAYEHANSARRALNSVAKLCARTHEFSVEMVTQLPKVAVHAGSGGAEGRSLWAKRGNVYFERVVGPVGKTAADRKSAMSESLSALAQSTTEVGAKADAASRIDDIAEMARAARELQALMIEADRAHGGSRAGLLDGVE
ncbi:MAG: hypothetical protein IPJ65_26180 [Archangiaceae bacterium]|nr:hypothetical protein [Archangiaceae bacterium]